jgi:kinesin family protein 4/21/27
MRLQDVLKEREQEIAHLEISLKEKEAVILTPSSLQEATGHHVDNTDNPSVFLSPRTINQFDEIKTVLQQGSGPDSADLMSNPESDEPLERLNELMRWVTTSQSAPTATHQVLSAMAQKESQHRESVEALNEELRQLRRQHDELTALSANQVHLKSADGMRILIFHLDHQYVQ